MEYCVAILIRVKFLLKV